MRYIAAFAAALLLGGCAGSPTSSLPRSSQASLVATAAVHSDSPSYLSENWTSYPLNTQWVDGSTHGNWYDQFDGGGSVHVSGPSNGFSSNYLYLKPQYVAGDTRSSLVTSLQTFYNNNFYAVSTFKTISQNRPSPNTWERAWFIWDYTSNTSFYNVVLKTNGWELDQENIHYPGYQRFLTSGTTPTFAVGSLSTVSVTQTGNSLVVNVNGNYLTSYTDTLYPLSSGKLGLYTEDAAVGFSYLAGSNN